MPVSAWAAARPSLAALAFCSVGVTVAAVVAISRRDRGGGGHDYVDVAEAPVGAMELDVQARPRRW